MSIVNQQHRRMPATDSKNYPLALLSGVMTVLLLIPYCAFAADGIVAVHENGRTIFVNNEAAPLPPDGTTNTPTVRKRLVYWSNVEHRWKRVPMTSAAARNARVAAQEVSAALVPESSLSAQNAAVSTPELTASQQLTQQNVDAAIEAAAKRHNVDANLVRALIKVESDFNPRAISSKGAMGLMQLMPATARQLKVANPFDANQNVDGGVRHLKLLLDNYGGNVQLSLAAYNAGAGAVSRNRGVPPYAETRDYVKKITKIYGNQTSGNASNIRTSRDAQGHLVISNE